MLQVVFRDLGRFGLTPDLILFFSTLLFYLRYYKVIRNFCLSLIKFTVFESVVYHKV